LIILLGTILDRKKPETGGFTIVDCFEKDEPPALFTGVKIYPQSLFIVAKK